MKNKIYYDSNGFNYKLVQTEDNWWSIYLYNENTGKYLQQIQAKDLEHAKNWCDLREKVSVLLDRLC